MKEIKLMNADTKIERIEKTLYGNGKPGLIETITRLDENVKILVATDSQLTTTVSALVKFMTDIQATEKAKKDMKANTRWLIGILVSINLALIAVIVTLLTT